MQPFNVKHVLIILISLVSLLLGLKLPYMYNFYLDVIVRSGIVALVFLFFTYKLKISEDINDFIGSFLQRLNLI